ncbi:MAG: PD-(D/E)XK nuclease family protein [Polyangiaceae bacterium]|nr:PD-(D/E)XK nuclease family protein [Polyangiaceae bacterium]NUQ78724.1 PD-(D/E)XK nuclease family protein [Polyangiaceae bacterium]
MVTAATPNALEFAFTDLETEWKAILAREASASATLLPKWEDSLRTMQVEEEALRRAGSWTRGAEDMLSVIGEARRELAHSALLAWLLDPESRHCIGTRFLKRLLRGTFPNGTFEDLHRVRVNREVVQADVRADIVIFGRGFTVVIENKVDADEGPMQCDRLYQGFASDPGVLFAFLTPDGRTPRSAGVEAQAAFKTISYRQIIAWLRAAIEEGASKETAGSQGYKTATNYLVTLEKEFA